MQSARATRVNFEMRCEVEVGFERRLQRGCMSLTLSAKVVAGNRFEGARLGTLVSMTVWGFILVPCRMSRMTM
jgi:hypothetical protein